MSNLKQIAGKARVWTMSVPSVLLVTLVFFAGCSEDSVGPEPQPEPLTLVEAISYYDWANGDLKYVEKTGEYWGNPEVVTYSGIVGRYSSLALDAQGIPHICYYAAGDLMYAVKTLDGWRTHTIDYDGNVGARCSMALDSKGVPHVSYYDLTDNDSVKYASKVSGVWKIETVPGPVMWSEVLDCREDWAYPTSIAVDPSGSTHIAYYTLTKKLGYAVRTADGEWSFELADSAGTVGAMCSLVLDPQGNPHISYLEHETDRVKYARKADGVWNREIIQAGDPSHWCFHYTALALDAEGNPHISFCASVAGTGYLGYLTRSAGSVWSCEIVDNASDNVGTYSSIAIDDQGNPRISYRDNDNQCLKYAVKIGSDWACGLVDQNGNVGYYTSIAVCYR